MRMEAGEGGAQATQLLASNITMPCALCLAKPVAQARARMRLVKAVEMPASCVSSSTTVAARKTPCVNATCLYCSSQSLALSSSCAPALHSLASEWQLRPQAASTLSHFYSASHKAQGQQQGGTTQNIMTYSTRVKAVCTSQGSNLRIELLHSCVCGCGHGCPAAVLQRDQEC